MNLSAELMAGKRQFDFGILRRPEEMLLTLKKPNKAIAR
jgi:hypothetical protein